jgi:hypothetical protein
VPCGESQEEQGGGERVGPPNQQVGKRNGKVYEKEKNKKRDPGGAMEDPSGDPRVAGAVRDAENECRREKKPGGEGEGRLGKEEGKEREEDGREPRDGMAKQKGHKLH